jgi:hypothetical protein
MTGSGSSVFGLFPDRNKVRRAQDLLKGTMSFPVSLVSRARYRSMWRRALAEYVTPELWPPQNRYSR